MPVIFTPTYFSHTFSYINFRNLISERIFARQYNIYFCQRHALHLYLARMIIIRRAQAIMKRYNFHTSAEKRLILLQFVIYTAVSCNCLLRNFGIGIFTKNGRVPWKKRLRTEILDFYEINGIMILMQN